MWSSVESGGGERAAPCARGKHSATLVGGHVYVLGGRGAGGAVPLRDFWRYCLASGSWERLECRGEPPPSLQEHSATAHLGRLYVFGGEAGALTCETPLWIYDIETQTWRKLPGESPRGSSVRRAATAGGPRGRRGHSAHALRDCLLVYGGYKDLRGSTNELWAFHYESESWHQVRTSAAGPARHRHAAALHGDRLYVHAGRCDLRACADLWYYDTMSRVWSQVRASKASPAARSGHAAARAGAHLYIFGGETHGHACNDMWRFHFATECWERIVPSAAVKWPSPRVDGCALLVRGAPPLRSAAPAPRRSAPAPAPAPHAILSKLSSFHVRRGARCSYSALAGDRDSTESLVRHEAQLCKSHSAHVIDKRRPPAPAPARLPRDPVSVPDFADAVPPAPSPVPRAALVHLDSEDEDRRGTAAEDDADLSTSDYASAERVNRLSGASLGFSNPHYLGPDVRALGQALTPDSGLGAGDIEMTELGGRARAGAGGTAGELHLLLVGGREPPHVALLQSPLSMWTYRLL